MTDPAIKAAQRVELPRQVEHHRVAAVQGAREALKPIRELHKPGPISRLSTAWMVGGTAECTTCRRDWPCSTARLIYTTEELDQ